MRRIDYVFHNVLTGNRVASLVHRWHRTQPQQKVNEKRDGEIRAKCSEKKS